VADVLDANLVPYLLPAVAQGSPHRFDPARQTPRKGYRCGRLSPDSDDSGLGWSGRATAERAQSQACSPRSFAVVARHVRRVHWELVTVARVNVRPLSRLSSSLVPT